MQRLSALTFPIRLSILLASLCFVSVSHELRSSLSSQTPSLEPWNLPVLEEASVEEISLHLSEGSFTSVDLVQTYIQRIEEVNHVVRAVSEINPDALDIAATLDRERLKGRVRGPFHGIPVLVKDNIATADKLNNTAGSYALLGAKVSREASVITRLRDAGAIILGKATMGEWAQYRSRWNHSSHGWSPYGGQALGVYYPSQDPSGSSSGSATAVALGLAAISLGTETSGSIVNPSEKSNLVGIKPTVGLTSRDMVVPISIRQDSVGPMARTVKDAAALLSIIAGKDKYDNWTMVQADVVPDFVTACDPQALRGARIGVPRNGMAPFLDEHNAPTMEAFEEALRLIGSAGASVTDSADFPSFDLARFSHLQGVVLDTDIVANLKRYLSKVSFNPYNIRGLQDIADFTRMEPREDFLGRGIHVWNSALGRNFTDESQESWDAYATNIHLATTEGIEGALDRYNLDALIMPTFTAFYLPAVGGLPVVTVPLGFFPPDTPIVMNAIGTMVTVGPGVPFGISFIGRAWSEKKLIALAYAFEQMTQARKQKQPHIIPGTTLHNLRKGTDEEVSVASIAYGVELSYESNWSLSSISSMFGFASLISAE